MVSNGERLTLLQLNDSHGYIELHPELFWRGNREAYRSAGGYARIATLFNEARKENPGGVVTLDNGDTIHGTFPAVNSRGEAMIPMLNQMGFDAMTAHWEFAYGPTQFQKIVDELDYPMLAINCHEEKTGELAFPPYEIVERKNMQIGVIGIAATIVDKTMPPHFSEGLRFTLGREELPSYVKELREKERVDLVIVLSHLGYPQELQLAEEVDGIDVLFSGHTHNRIYEAVIVNGVIIIQSGCHGSFVGRLDLEVSDRKVERFDHRLITVEESIEPDESVGDTVERCLSPFRDELDQVVGETETPLNRSRVLESTMDNLLLRAIRKVAETDLAFSNGWRYGAPILPGPVEVNDLWNIVPTDPPISVCRITGEALWGMMEENLEHTFSRNPYMQMGGYVKRCLGLNIYFKIESPRGKRIQEFFVGGSRLKKDRRYSACFLTNQGIPKKYGEEKEDLDVGAIEALELFMNEESPVKSKYRGDIVPI
jgi:2',3'-cyclic-nucleotide 2'-phosphodiesterase (5'-nucleotidase family)